jgi:oligopeptidase A
VSNPLLSEGFPLPYDAVTPAHVAPAVDTLLEDAAERLRALESLTETPNFDNCMLALEGITERLDRAMRMVAHLESVATSDELREAYNEAQPKVSAFASKIPLSASLWQVVKRYAETPQAKALTGPRKRFVKKTVSYFRRHGADLDDEGKARLEAIDVELTKLTLKYAQNTLDGTNAFELVLADEAQLVGLPPSAVAAARQNAEAKEVDGWRFTLQYPSYIPVLRYLDDPAIRERMYRAMATRAASGEFDNRDLVGKIVRLRRERATLLGYPSFADLVTEERMAKSGARARAFIDDLRERTLASFERERDELLAFRRKLEGSDAPVLEPWDTSYYAEKLRKERYNFDDEILKPYFAFGRVVEGIFAIAGKLYGLRFEPWTDAPKWHETVSAFKVIDAESDRWLAGIYCDPFPRETKQSGAWMDGQLTRTRDDDDGRHIGLVVANMTPPVGDAPALLSHRDVETLFHEFGHLLHHCLSRTELRSQAGTNVAWDFVELPSQIFENWCWEREAVDLFARHYETDAPIPDELFDALKRARTFRAATAQMRQLGFATVDLAVHIDFEPDRDGDPVAYGRTILGAHSPDPLPEDHAMLASFGHLFGDPTGYAAAYYSYKWAEVLDADAFTRFATEGLLDPTVGRAFRERILARGDEDDPAELYRAFMGRDPELGPLLERLGLAG